MGFDTSQDENRTFNLLIRGQPLYLIVLENQHVCSIHSRLYRTRGPDINIDVMPDLIQQVNLKRHFFAKMDVHIVVPYRRVFAKHSYLCGECVCVCVR